MLDMKDTANKIRETFNCYVTKGFLFKDEYVFVTVNRDYKKMFTNSMLLKAANIETGEIYPFDMARLINGGINDLKEYADARDNRFVEFDILPE